MSDINDIGMPKDVCLCVYTHIFGYWRVFWTSIYYIDSSRGCVTRIHRICVHAGRAVAEPQTVPILHRRRAAHRSLLLPRPTVVPGGRQRQLHHLRVGGARGRPTRARRLSVDEVICPRCSLENAIFILLFIFLFLSVFTCIRYIN